MANHMTLWFVLQPNCHLHLHLRWADNPYVSGTVHTKDSAPGLIMGAGEDTEYILTINFLIIGFIDSLTFAVPDILIEF